MAKEYGFQYELVQYKWPHWLHQQTEKQRIIWGYKILFLDVLFPLAVDKVIFVDADQVTRVITFILGLLCIELNMNIRICIACLLSPLLPKHTQHDLSYPLSTLS